MPDGEQALQATIELERSWISLNGGEERPEPFSYVANVSGLPLTTPIDSYEAVIAGGGLGLVAGVALARRGLRVMVFDRDRVGAAHREWNISAHELASLALWGIFSHDEIAS